MTRRSRAIQLHQEGRGTSYIARRLRLTFAQIHEYLNDLSPLEKATNRLYARCQRKGGCIPSGIYVTRPFPQGDIDLPECQRCRVPIRGKSAATRWKLSENTTLFRGKAA